MLENNREKCQPSQVIFKAAIRAVLAPPKRSKGLENILNKTDSSENSSDAMQTIRSNILKNKVCSSIDSAIKEIMQPNLASPSPPSSPVFTTTSTQTISSDSFDSTNLSPASSSGYFSASPSENSYERFCDTKTPEERFGGNMTPGEGICDNKAPQKRFAHPEFQNIVYIEPKKSPSDVSLDSLASNKSYRHTYSTQSFSGRSWRDREISEKSSVALKPVHNLFSFNEATYYDTHCHLDFLLSKADFGGSFSEFMTENQQEFPPSFGGCIAVFCNPYSFRRILSWKKHLEGNVWASFGCHPKNAASYDDVIEEDLLLALQHPKVRALGEIGLDYSERSLCSERKQKEVFRRQLVIAKERNLPVVIHCRDAYEDCFDILNEVLPNAYLIHLHCFTESWSIAEKYLKAFPNLFIGLTNLVTFPGAVEVHEVARKIPLDRLLLETDAPYFVPTPLSKKARFAHPGMAIFVADKVASLRGVSLQDVVLYTKYNTAWVYGV